MPTLDVPAHPVRAITPSRRVRAWACNVLPALRELHSENEAPLTGQAVHVRIVPTVHHVPVVVAQVCLGLIRR